MREIRFRFWAKNVKRMKRCVELNPFYIGDCDRLRWNSDEVELMQYTNLKDKAGVDIFEGDIVRHSDAATDISIVRFGEFGVPNMEEEEYQDTAIGFYFENASEFKDVMPFNMTVPLNTEWAKGIVVIGNIYENSDLLEVNHGE